MAHRSLLRAASWLRRFFGGPRRKRRRLALALGALLIVFYGSHLVPHRPLGEGIPGSRAVLADDGTLLRLTLASDGQYRLWTPLAEIAPGLVEGTLLYEDRFFRYHPGVNPAALLRAAGRTYLRRGPRQGGSTLTMQLARRLYGIDSQRFTGKVRQILRALWLELRYSKDEILEAYLNLMPLGGNIEGVGAASLIYFGRPARRLQLAEALTLAVIPQSPSVRGTPLARGRPVPGTLIAARDRLFASYRARINLSAAERASIDLPLAIRGTGGLPFLAPHLSEAVLQRAGNDLPAVRTTLSLPLQQILERQIALHLERERHLGVSNAVAMLVDTRSLAVQALVGSADYFDDAIAGQVNGTGAKRSPGSALKPFAYGLGIDQGVILPDSILRDVPRSFASYAPENFDGQFAGLLTATQALVRSRNVPAVTVAAQLNRPSLFSLLRTAGVAGLVSEEHHGLGIVLGTAEVTMQELVELYAALANGGRVKPLRFRQADPGASGVSILSPEASFLVLEMLRETPRPDWASVSGSRSPKDVAWKTGTSWGFRDAWTVGVLGSSVLCVWVGDFSGASNPAFVGISAAAPLFFSIVDALRAERPGLFPRARPRVPENLTKVELCALSGALPSRHCPRTKQGWFIPGRSPIDRCQVHQELAIDLRTGERVCGPHEGPTRSEVYEVWPSELAKLFAKAGLPRRALPPPGPSCLAYEQHRGRPPRITSPLASARYVLSARKTEWPPLPFLAEVEGDARRVFWHVDRRFVGASAGGAPLLWRPQPGTFLVRAVDDRGRAESVTLRVELAP
jgi:penicillin-binding protein 1C